jgi:hypothetical protein
MFKQEEKHEILTLIGKEIASIEELRKVYPTVIHFQEGMESRRRMLESISIKVIIGEGK